MIGGFNSYMGGFKKKAAKRVQARMPAVPRVMSRTPAVAPRVAPRAQMARRQNEATQARVQMAQRKAAARGRR